MHDRPGDGKDLVTARILPLDGSRAQPARSGAAILLRSRYDSMAKTERLFVALPLNDAFRAEVEEYLGGAVGALPGRTVPPQNWHLTLCFLGDTPAAERERLCAQLDTVDLGTAFPLVFTSLGAFPRAARASVLWLGTREGSGPTATLAERVASAARAAGLEPDAKPFKPHLTLSRLRTPQDLRPLIERVPEFGHVLHAERVVLYRSRPGAGAPRYEEVAGWRLSTRV
jgi:RNA 2',3'-cyclic 3'-phosphodiesterase